jgi:hypothetical protein
MRAFVVPEHPRLDVAVIANGTAVATWRFTQSDAEGPRDAVIPGRLLVAASALYLRFLLSEPARPSDVGLSVDSRLLGIEMHDLRMTARANASPR